MKRFVIEFSELTRKNGNPRRFGHLKIRRRGTDQKVSNYQMFSNTRDMFSYMAATAEREMKNTLGTRNLVEILANAEVYHSLDNVVQRIDICPRSYIIISL